MQAALDAISNPQRRQILRLVWDAELSSGEIASHFNGTWQAVSRNLRVLREAGLVSERRAGRSRIYRAQRDRLGPLEKVLRDFWHDDLERLGRVLAEEEPARITD